MEAEKQSIVSLSPTIPLEKSSSDNELSPSSKEQNQPSASKNDEHQEILSEELNPIEQILQQVTTSTDDHDSDEDEQKKKIAAAKKLLFPGALATSYPEVMDTLRSERRQEFCPIYKDETPEAIAERQVGRKPVGSLLAKRIRWDDLKRKREEDQRRAHVPLRYGPYGPIYSDLQPSFQKTYGQNRGNMQSQPPPSFANPYEQYYTAAQHQYDQMAQMNRVQQEYGGFWPEHSQPSTHQNNYQQTQNFMEQSIQPYTYPYPSIHFNPATNAYPNYPAYLRQPPPPPPSEPYPY